MNDNKAKTVPESGFILGHLKKWLVRITWKDCEHIGSWVVDVFNYTRKRQSGKGFLITHENGQEFDWFRLHPGIVV
jgi:hypothetical protein